LNGRQGGLKSRSGGFWRKETSLVSAGNQTSERPACYYKFISPSSQKISTAVIGLSECEMCSVEHLGREGRGVDPQTRSFQVKKKRIAPTNGGEII